MLYQRSMNREGSLFWILGNVKVMCWCQEKMRTSPRPNARCSGVPIEYRLNLVRDGRKIKVTAEKHEGTSTTE